MKNLFFPIFAFLFTFALSCDDEETKPEIKPYTPDYKDQIVQGKINGVEFTGTVSAFYYNDTTTGIQLRIFNRTMPCITDMGELYTTFSVPGRVDSHYLVNSGGTTIVSVYNNSTHLEIKDGVIEIQSIILSLGGYTRGRLDIKKDENNYLNGKFDAWYCN